MNEFDYGVLLTHHFDLSDGLVSLERLDDCPTLDTNAENFKEQHAVFEESSSPCWIHSTKTFNLSSLFYSYRLDKADKQFADKIASMVGAMFEVPTQSWRVGLIKTPVCGIDWHEDKGAFRNCGLNIGLLNTDGYDVIFKDGPTFTIGNNQAMLLNVNRMHRVQNKSQHSRQRVLVTYSFDKTYDDIVKTLIT
jgi:hypothetical protein